MLLGLGGFSLALLRGGDRDGIFRIVVAHGAGSVTAVGHHLLGAAGAGPVLRVLAGKLRLGGDLAGQQVLVPVQLHLGLVFGGVGGRQRSLVNALFRRAAQRLLRDKDAGAVLLAAGGDKFLAVLGVARLDSARLEGLFQIFAVLPGQAPALQQFVHVFGVHLDRPVAQPLLPEAAGFVALAGGLHIVQQLLALFRGHLAFGRGGCLPGLCSGQCAARRRPDRAVQLLFPGRGRLFYRRRLCAFG